MALDIYIPYPYLTHLHIYYSDETIIVGNGREESQAEVVYPAEQQKRSGASGLNYTVGFQVSKFILRRSPLVMASAAWEEEEWELCNDEGFVYRRKKRRLDSNGATAATAPPATDPEADQRLLKERRRRALLKLKDQYQREIDQWQHMSDTLQAMENRTQPQPSSSMQSARPQPPESESACRQLIDDLLLQAEAQEAILQDLSNLCDMAEALGKDQEERLKQPFINLPVWASPRALMASLSDD